MAHRSNNLPEDKDLFAKVEHAKTYHLYRPKYPQSVFKTMVDYLSISSESGPNLKFKLAVDMACGTGQATPPLAEYFEKVIGCDVSKSQIDQANQHNKHGNIEYRTSPAEDMPFVKDGSADLVTCALGFHWLDHKKAYTEVKRILRSGGVLVIYAYDMPILSTNEATAEYMKFWNDTLRAFASPQAEILLNRYRDLDLPFDDVTRNEDLSIEVDMPMSSFIGYIESYSPYQNLLSKHPESDCLQQFANRLQATLCPEAGAEDDPVIHVSYPIIMLMGRKPY